jgi:hypothetical protein
MQPVGRGLSMEIGTTATIARARIEGSKDVAILADDGSRLMLREAGIVDTGGLGGAFGRGIQAQNGSRIDLEGASLRNSLW